MTARKHLKTYQELARQHKVEPLAYLFKRLDSLQGKANAVGEGKKRDEIHAQMAQLAMWLAPYGHAKRAPEDAQGDVPETKVKIVLR